MRWVLVLLGLFLLVWDAFWARVFSQHDVFPWANSWIFGVPALVAFGEALVLAVVCFAGAVVIRWADARDRSGQD
jgi:hypothetical protein